MMASHLIDFVMIDTVAKQLLAAFGMSVFPLQNIARREPVCGFAENRHHCVEIGGVGTCDRERARFGIETGRGA